MVLGDPKNKWGSGQASVTSEETLGTVGQRKLAELCAALELPAATVASARKVFALLTKSWAHVRYGVAPPWPNDITDDGTPFEYSVEYSGDKPTIRLLVESMGSHTMPHASWHAGLELTETLVSEKLADPALLRPVQSLFEPRQTSFAGRFLLWHGATLTQPSNPLIKIYLNPRVNGDDRAADLVAEALRRLGLHQAWDFLEPKLQEEATRVYYFSVDMRSDEGARVKVYVGRADSASAIERLALQTRGFEAGEIASHLVALSGRDASYGARPPLICYAFTAAWPPSVTLHVPIRCHVSSDAEALERITPLMDANGARLLRQATQCLARQPLTKSQNIVTYASLSRKGSSKRLTTTVYLAPKLYSTQG